jgi:hypothetical protein
VIEGPANGCVWLRIVAVLGCGVADRPVQARNPFHRCTAAVAAAPLSGTGKPPEISAGRHRYLST